MIEQLWTEHVQLMGKDYDGADEPDADSSRRHWIEDIIALTVANTVKEAACKAKLLALAEQEGWRWRDGQKTELARRLAAELDHLADTI